MSTPVSMTATRTPLPVDCFHNSSIRTRCNDQGRPAYFAEGKVHWVESSAAAGSTGSVTKRTAVAAAAVSGRRYGCEEECVVMWIRPSGTLRLAGRARRQAWSGGQERGPGGRDGSGHDVLVSE